MTKTQFKKEGWLDYFIQFDESELTTIVMLVRNLLETGCWEPTVHYCRTQIELSQIEEEELSDSETLH